MAVTYTPIPDSDVDSESPVTTSLMTLLRDNPIAIAEGASGAPAIQTAALEQTGGSEAVTQATIRAAAVGQGELKTTVTNGSINIASNSNGSYTLTGGTYSWWTASSADDGNGLGLSFGGGNTSSGVIGLANNGGSLLAFYVDERYIQSSRPYNTGDGDYGLVVYVLLDKNKNILATRVGPDPMWAYNGPTNIASKGNGLRMEKQYIVEDYMGKIDIKNSLRDPIKRQSMMEYMRSKEGCKLIPLKITHAIKNRDIGIFPHPWVNSIEIDQTVVMLDPVSDFSHQLLEVHEHGEVNIRDEFILSGELKIDNISLKRSGPPGV